MTMSSAPAADRDVQTSVRDRAMLATAMSVTIADARTEDFPLIWVNPAFTVTTGYSAAESIGRNCRFLQGPGTDPAQAAAMGAAIDGGYDVTVTLRNYRKDGTAFWNECRLSPVFDADGVLTHVVGIQADVTLRVAAEEERDRAVAAERVAHDQMALLADAGSLLAGTSTVGASLAQLSALLVPRVADWVRLVGAGEPGQLREVVTRHRPDQPKPSGHWTRERGAAADDAIRALLDGAPAWRSPDASGSADAGAPHPAPSDPAALGLAEAGAATSHSTTAARAAVAPAAARQDARTGESALCVPLPGASQVVGAMVLVRGPQRPAHTARDLAVAVDLGRRTGLSLDNTRLYQAEHRIAETLQRSLLPAIPQIAGLSAAARYRASANSAQVGGDFYELLELPDGAIGLAIGDVVGHDLRAAATMGHLRGLLRACAWDVETSDASLPAGVLHRVDRLMQGLHVTSMATLCYARLEPPGQVAAAGVPAADAVGDRWRLQYSSAGHPPLLLRRPDGSVQVLDDANGLLLGVQSSARTTATVAVEPGSTLLAYTDGVVERRGEHLDTGIERLVDLLRGSRDTSMDALCDRVLVELGDSHDDVALLAVRLH